MLSIELAELVALSTGLQWAKEVGIDAFILESDSINVVQRLNSREVDLSVPGHVVDKVQKLRDEFQECRIAHVCRTGNTPAHLLAKLSLFLEDRVTW